MGRFAAAALLAVALTGPAWAAAHKPLLVIPRVRPVAHKPHKPAATAIAAVASAPAASAAPDAAAATAPAAPALSNFADTVFAGIVGENAPILSMDFGAGIVLGGMPLSLEKTTLDQLQQSFGGLIHSQGDAGNAVSWICYTRHAAKKGDTPTTAWFTSTSEMASAANTLSMVVVQRVDASHKSGCATAPKTFVFPTFGVPGLDATVPELTAKFGPLKRDRQGNLYFTSTRPLNDGSGRTVYQTIGYAIGKKKPTASAIAISQVTTD